MAAKGATRLRVAKALLIRRRAAAASCHTICQDKTRQDKTRFTKNN
jgi:hypothetical protein